MKPRMAGGRRSLGVAFSVGSVKTVKRRLAPRILADRTMSAWILERKKIAPAGADKAKPLPPKLLCGNLSG